MGAMPVDVTKNRSRPARVHLPVDAAGVDWVMVMCGPGALLEICSYCI